MVHTTGWLKGLQVTADGTGIVSHAGRRWSEDGWRYSLRVTSLPPHTRGWRGQNAYIDAATGWRTPSAPARTAASASTRPPRWR